ncbi:MAG: DNA-directed RNA polymerase subunit alpha [Elusimicrobia bacterium ADurb.Bin231]|nr:MAG: DNA-directed RNA polymerase subunit alpha [Elusimicrobia bacterium ADurb.Bin231]
MQLPDIVVPQKIEKKISADNTYGKFIVEPFERGYGQTVGHSLRRILLSSLEGAAVIGVRIKGALHEFATMPGVSEDVMGIILNLKKLRFKMYSNDIQILRLSTSKEGSVKASQIETNANVEILNGDLVITDLDAGASLDMEIDVIKGRGYSSAEKNTRQNQPVGTIAIDSVFSPIKKVYYEVENTRVGQATDYDRLILDVWTDGSINPEDAVAYSAKLLRDSSKIFLNFDDEEKEVEDSAKDAVISAEQAPNTDILKQPVEIIELPIRAVRCLKNAKVKTIGDLLKKSREELLSFKNFGSKSLEELDMKLKELGVSLKE